VSEPASPHAVEVRLSAVTSSVPEARAVARRFTVDHGADADVLRSILIASTEAVSNAVLHAFVGRQPGTVRLALAAASEEICVTVADNGRGMRPDPTSSRLGLGLPTIAHLATELNVLSNDEEGTELRMRFRAPGVHGPVPGARIPGPPPHTHPPRLS
jgi:stage II sporulation protein AB (anti-sigma F factor)